jgi:hypothetical protein
MNLGAAVRVTASLHGRVVAGCEDGSLHLLSGAGKIVGRMEAGSRITALTALGETLVAGCANGNVLQPVADPVRVGPFAGGRDTPGPDPVGMPVGPRRIQRHVRTVDPLLPAPVPDQDAERMLPPARVPDQVPLEQPLPAHGQHLRLRLDAAPQGRQPAQREQVSFGVLLARRAGLVVGGCPRRIVSPEGLATEGRAVERPGREERDEPPVPHADPHLPLLEDGHLIAERPGVERGLQADRPCADNGNLLGSGFYHNGGHLRYRAIAMVRRMRT